MYANNRPSTGGGGSGGGAFGLPMVLALLGVVMFRRRREA
jgi:LPXTG-motif cell wall-anchored protein